MWYLLLCVAYFKAIGKMGTCFFPPLTFIFSLPFCYLLECGAYFNVLPTFVCYLLEVNWDYVYFYFFTYFLVTYLKVVPTLICYLLLFFTYLKAILSMGTGFFPPSTKFCVRPHKVHEERTNIKTTNAGATPSRRWNSPTALFPWTVKR